MEDELERFEWGPDVWELGGIRAAFPALQLLGELLPDATLVVTAGSRRVWCAPADPFELIEMGENPLEVMAAMSATGAMATPSRESNLPFTAGTLSRLLLAAQADGEAAFCDELRIYRGDDLLLRWAQPVGGALRVAATVPEQRIWRFATLAVATYKRARGTL